MDKLFVSVCSKINGLDTMTIQLVHDEVQYSIDCHYSDYGESFYGHAMTLQEINALISFLTACKDSYDE